MTDKDPKYLYNDKGCIVGVKKKPSLFQSVVRAEMKKTASGKQQSVALVLNKPDSASGTAPVRSTVSKKPASAVKSLGQQQLPVSASGTANRNTVVNLNATASFMKPQQQVSASSVNSKGIASLRQQPVSTVSWGETVPVVDDDDNPHLDASMNLCATAARNKFGQEQPVTGAHFDQLTANRQFDSVGSGYSSHWDDDNSIYANARFQSSDDNQYIGSSNSSTVRLYPAVKQSEVMPPQPPHVSSNGLISITDTIPQPPMSSGQISPVVKVISPADDQSFDKIALLNQIEQLQLQVSSERSKKEELEGRVAKLELAVEKSSSEAEQHKLAARELGAHAKREVDAANNRVHDLSGRLDVCHRNVESLTQALVAAKSQNVALSQQLANALSKKSVGNSSRDISTAQDKIELQDRLARLQSQIAQLGAK